MKRVLSISLAAIGLALTLHTVHAQEDPGSSIDQAQRLLNELGDAAFASPNSLVEQIAIQDALRHDIESMRFEDDPIGKEPARSVFGSNPLTGDGNPLLDENSRQIWLAQAIDDIGFDMVSAHLKEQAAAMRDGSIDRAGWYEHVAHCTKLCNPVVQGLLLEHIRQVAARPHVLATFATNRADLTTEAANELRGFLREQNRESDPARFLLIGRASRTGKRIYNRELSARRVQSVRRALADAGIPGDQITGFWLGYEPPQITNEIALAYALPRTLDDLGRNQSVLVVAYRPNQIVEPSS